MFREVLKIIPRLDQSALSSMERGLSSRFSRVAKRFGTGIVGALKGGAVIGAVTYLVDKLLNPLKEVQAAIDRSLSAGDDLATYAQQFNTTPGNLARLQAFGRASGLEPESLRYLIGKFQSSVAQAAANPGEQTAVSKYVGKRDVAQSFFEFIQALQKLTPTQQNLVQQEVFGERQILKASEFLNADFGQLSKMIGGPDSELLSAASGKLGLLSDRRDILAARRELNDLVDKARLIDSTAVKQIDEKERLSLRQENENLTKVSDIQRISIENQKLFMVVEQQFLRLAPLLAEFLPVVTKAIPVLIQYAPAVQAFDAMKDLSKSRGARGMNVKDK